MSHATSVHVANVTGNHGILGTIEVPVREDPGHGGAITLTLADGRKALLPREMLTAGPDGTYRASLDASDLEPSQQQEPPTSEDGSERQVIPVIEERLRVGKEGRDTGVVRVRKLVREHEETVELPVVRDVVDVQRVMVEKFIDTVPPVRHDGDVIVVPVVEEVLVVEKRLMLREELHISRHSVRETSTQQVTLQSEEPVIERESNPPH